MKKIRVINMDNRLRVKYLQTNNTIL